MPLTPYDRNNPPTSINYDGFPVEVAAVNISLHEEIKSDRLELFADSAHYRLHPTLSEAGRVLNPDDHPDGEIRHLNGRQIKVCMSVSHIRDVHAFMPDGALFLSSRPTLVEESLWHATLFFTDHFRNDRNTNWKWKFSGRIPDSTQTVTGRIGYAYHVFYWQYFHWLMDCAPRFWALSRFNPYQRREKIAYFTGQFAEDSFQYHTLRMMGIDTDWLLMHERNRAETLHFDEIVYPCNAFHESAPSRPSVPFALTYKGWSTEYLSYINAAARRYGPVSTMAGPRRIWCSRADAAHRRVLNEDELLPILKARGFTIICPGKLGFLEQVAAFGSADVVVGPHGAGLTNMLFSKEDCVLVEIFPHLFGDAGYLTLCRMLDRPYYALLARTVDSPHGAPFADLVVDVGSFERALDELGL